MVFLLTEIKLKGSISWDITPCSPIKVNEVLDERTAFIYSRFIITAVNISNHTEIKLFYITVLRKHKRLLQS
jgi:hypothetical protein